MPKTEAVRIGDVNTIRRWQIGWISSCVGLACAALLLATAGPMAMVWDEGDTIVRAQALDFRQPDQWPYTVRLEGHPPLAGLLIAAGKAIAPASMDPLTRERLGPILFFSLAAAALCYRMQRDYQCWAASLMAVFMLLASPRLFAHAHYATLDGPLTAAWLLAWATFAPACRSWWSVPAFGVALGLTLSAKFTGWLAVIPFAAWIVLYRDLRAGAALMMGVPIALAVFVALNPPLWSATHTGLATFFDLNLNRASRPEHNISTQFFGRMYNLDFPLPWYNALVWTALTITPLPLVIGGAGIVGSVRRWRTDRASILLVLQWVTLILVRALPWSPPHDAERLILPSFAFFAALIGVGFGRGLYRETLLSEPRIVAQGWAKVAILLTLAAATVDVLGFYPQDLSYYSRLIGGIRGATALGMEPTYYWDSLDRRALDWLNTHTHGDEKPQFAAAPPRNLELLKQWGKLQRIPTDPGNFRWYVLQRRPSALQPVDHWLIEHAEPKYQTIVGGVPLLDVYDYADYERAPK